MVNDHITNYPNIIATQLNYFFSTIDFNVADIINSETTTKPKHFLKKVFRLYLSWPAKY